MNETLLLRSATFDLQAVNLRRAGNAWAGEETGKIFCSPPRVAQRASHYALTQRIAAIGLSINYVTQLKRYGVTNTLLCGYFSARVQAGAVAA